MRRALCITPFSPLPATEGHRKRILSTIGVLKRLGFTIDLLMLCRDHFWHHSAGEQHFAELRELVDSFHFVPGDYLARDDGQDWGLDDWMSSSFDAYVKWLADKRNYDAVFCNYVFLSGALVHFPASVCRIIDTHDRFGGRRELLMKNDSRVEFFYTTEREEGIGLDRSDLAIAIKEQEEAYFRQITARHVVTLPYVEQRQGPSTSPQRKRSEQPIFGYFASSNWINRENFSKFVERYKASERFKRGERLNLQIFGSLCDVLGQDSGTYRSQGRVGDVAEFYDNIDCVIIPQEFSTGLKIKISEALSFGVPIISHLHALEGFPVQPDALMSCRSFEEIVERCFAVQEDPSLLESLQKESLRTQEMLLKNASAAEEAIGRFIEDRLPTICVVVSRGSLAKDQIYFEALQCALSALASAARISLCVYGDPPMAIHEYEFKSGRYINEFWNANSPEDIENWIKGRRAWLMLILSPSVELASRIDRDGLGHPGQILYFGDFCAHAAMVAGDSGPPIPRNCIEASGRRSGDFGGISIWHLRWLPWSLSFAGALASHTVSERGVLFTRSCSTSNPLFQEFLTVVSLDRADEDAMGVSEFIRMLMTTRVRPRFIVDETGFTPAFRLLFEMLYLNGIPIFSTSDDDSQFLYDGGIADWRISLLFAQESANVAQNRAPNWQQSGWDMVRRLARRVFSPGQNESGQAQPVAKLLPAIIGGE